MGEPIECHEARVGTRQIDGDGAPARTEHGRRLLQQRRGLLDSGQAFDAPEQPFRKAAGATRAQLQARGSDHGAHDFAGGAGDAGRRHDRGEHERHPDRHADAGQQLLDGMHPQPAAVEVQQRACSQQRLRAQCLSARQR